MAGAISTEAICGAIQKHRPVVLRMAGRIDTGLHRQPA